MKPYLKNYQMKLTAVGPVFIGSGREISKKEYMFLTKNTVGMADMEKMYAYLTKKHKQQAFDEFLLNRPKDDLKHWLSEQRIDREEIRPYMKYVLDSGDTSLARGTKVTVMECVKDAYGKPYVPGSSMKGMLRTILLSADMIRHPENYAQEKQRLAAAADIPKSRTSYLSREEKAVEEKGYHVLERTSKIGDAVNDIMAGIVVSDSEPLSMDDIVLCQRVERHTDGTEKNLNVLRECIRPETEIFFSITVDESLCKITVEELMKAVEIFAESYQKNFLSAFQGMKPCGKSGVYLGGGSGFVSKTIVYPMYGKKQGINLVKTIFDKTRVPREHKHYRDTEYGAAPHIVKCTKYHGKTMQMGLCTLSER